MIDKLRSRLNRQFRPECYQRLLASLEHLCGGPIGFPVAETPVFVPCALLEAMANAGAEMATALIGDKNYMAAAHDALPSDYRVAGEPSRPHFLSANFGLVQDASGQLVPHLVEIRCFPSVYAFQTVLADAYRHIYELDESLGIFLGGVDEDEFWTLFTRTVLGTNDPAHVVLTGVDPVHQKAYPDFELTKRHLGLAVLDLRDLETLENRLQYRGQGGQLVPVHRIYNRAIANEMTARGINLPFDLTHSWDLEWAGHPNWYFLISNFSLPWLSRPPLRHPLVPPAVFLDEFLEGRGRSELEAAGVSLPPSTGPQTIYRELLLKPLFSFARKQIVFEPTQQQLEAIQPAHRQKFLVQQRMSFAPTVQTPHGLMQAEIRILYLWPDEGLLTPVLPLVHLRRSNRNQQGVSVSAAFYPR